MEARALVDVDVAADALPSVGTLAEEPTEKGDDLKYGYKVSSMLLASRMHLQFVFQSRYRAKGNAHL